MLLNCHTYYSLGYGTLSVPHLLEQLQTAGYTQAVIADINNTSACLEALRLAPEYNLNLQLGIDFRNHTQQQFIGIAQNNAGFRELNTYLSTMLAQKKAFPNRAPEFKDSMVVYPTQNAPKMPLARHEYIGVNPQDLANLQWRKSPYPPEKLVVLQTVSFTTKRGFNTHRLLRAIHDNALLSKLPAAHQAPQSQNLPHQDALSNAYAHAPQILRNTQHLLAQCDIAFEFGVSQNKKHYTGDAQSDIELLEHEVEKGLQYRFTSPGPEIHQRIAHELDILKQKEFASYFLINWDMVQYALHKGYPYVGRGSGANSLVAYLLRITDVEPLELDLYFERFINPHRDVPPDFDIDFSWTDRDDVTQYLFKKHGHEHTALLGSYITFKHKSVFRELGKVFGLPADEIEKLQRNPNPQQDEYAKWIINYTQHIAGFPSHLSVHACGIVIAEKPIHHFCGTFIPPKNFPTTQFDMEVAEDAGLYKFDVLSQRGLGKIYDSAAMVKERHGVDIDVHNTQLFRSDEKVKTMLREGNTVGCFYVESPAMRSLLTKLKADDYLRLVAASSIIRPGVAKSGMMREYILRFREPERREKARKELPELYAILEETYGVMVYQEDVMKVASRFADLTMAEADILRRGMSWNFKKRTEFVAVKEKFFSNCKQKGYSQEVVSDIWRQIETFASFAFSKGHSASYAVESYQAMYLKAHYPLEYMVACINNGGGFYSRELYLHEAKRYGGTVEVPCINNSAAGCHLKGNHIFIGLGMVNGLETKLVARILADREQYGTYTSLEDFVDRIPIDLEQLCILVRLGAFRTHEPDKKKLLWRAHTLLSSEPVAKEKTQRLFAQPTKNYDLPPLWHHQLQDIFDEIELLGFTVKNTWKLLKTPPTEQLTAADLPGMVGKEVTLAAYLVHIKRTATSNGKKMFFGTWLDRNGNWVDTVHFPPVAARYPFRGKGHYRIRGTVQNEYDFITIEVNRMELLAIQNLEEV